MIDTLEAGEEHLTLVHRRIEAQVSIDVGVDDHVGRLRDDDLVVDHRDAQRRDQRGFLHERVRGLGLAVPVLVLHHDDAIALGLPGMMGAVAHPFRHPDAAFAIDVDVGRIVEQGRCGPQRHFEPVRHLKEVERDARGLSSRSLSSLRGRLLERLRRGCGSQHQHEHQVQRREEKSTHKSPSMIGAPGAGRLRPGLSSP